MEERYKKYNEEVIKKQEQMYITAMSKVPQVKEFFDYTVKARVYGINENTMKGYLKTKFPEDFEEVGEQKNLNHIREAIKRDIIIVAPECKSTDEVLTRISSKYFV